MRIGGAGRCRTQRGAGREVRRGGKGDYPAALRDSSRVATRQCARQKVRCYTLSRSGQKRLRTYFGRPAGPIGAATFSRGVSSRIDSRESSALESGNLRSDSSEQRANAGPSSDSAVAWCRCETGEGSCRLNTAIASECRRFRLPRAAGRCRGRNSLSRVAHRGAGPVKHAAAPANAGQAVDGIVQVRHDTERSVVELGKLLTPVGRKPSSLPVSPAGRQLGHTGRNATHAARGACRFHASWHWIIVDILTAPCTRSRQSSRPLAS